jgi:hypothetical protein
MAADDRRVEANYIFNTCEGVVQIRSDLDSKESQRGGSQSDLKIKVLASGPAVNFLGASQADRRLWWI